MKKSDFKTMNATFICGNYKIIVLDSISLVLYRTLSSLLETLLEFNDVCFAMRRFVDYLAVDLMLPLQVVALTDAKPSDDKPL